MTVTGRASKPVGVAARRLASSQASSPSPYSWVNTAVAGPSQSSQDYTPPFTATCLQCLLDEGAEVEGMTKMDEFGMGSTTSHLPAHYTPVHNPARPSTSSGLPRSAGGSSGGSAAAVADGSAWAALGTDTGGSVRLPAAYCGVVGFKPSYGMISRHGVIAYADSLDTVGILSRNVETARRVYATVSRPDQRDMTCASVRLRERAASLIDAHISAHLPSLASSGGKTLEGLRIGIPAQMTSTAIPSSSPDSPVSSPPSSPSHLPALPQALLKHLVSLGATLHPVDLPSLTRALPAYYVLASAEASSNLARYGGGWFGSSWERARVGASANDLDAEGVQTAAQNETGEERRRRIRTEGFGREVKKRLLAGTYALSADEFNNTYLKALYLRSLLRADFARVLRIPDARTLPASASILQTAQSETGRGVQVDVLLHPTAIGSAPLLHQPTHSTAASTPKRGTGGPESEENETTCAQEYAQDVLTVPASLAGLPAVSVPAGHADDGWSVGVSVVSQWGAERVVLGVAEAVEQWSRHQTP